MTYEEAILLLECEATNLVGWGASEQDEKKAQLIFDKVDAIDIAIECIKKQMPKPKKKTDLNGKCGSCKYATPNETHFGCSPCYIICKKPDKVFRTYMAPVKQRTSKACKGYERAEDE